MEKLIIKLDSIFESLKDDIAYLAITSDGYVYRQVNKSHVVNFINFDLKKSAFLSFQDIRKNKEVITKVKTYLSDSNSFVSMMPYKLGFEIKVYNKYGNLIYHQYIKLVSTYGWLVNKYYSKKYPELTLLG